MSEYSRGCIELLKRTVGYLESIEYIMGGDALRELKRDINKQLGEDLE